MLRLTGAFQNLNDKTLIMSSGFFHFLHFIIDLDLIYLTESMC